MLQGESMDVPLYGCIALAPRIDHYRLLPGVIRFSAQAGHLPAAVQRPGPEEGRMPESGSHCPAAVPVVGGGHRQVTVRATPETADAHQGTGGGVNG